jgi:hypothetical protein
MSHISERVRDMTSDISDPRMTGLACRGAGFIMMVALRGVKMSHVPEDMERTGLSFRGRKGRFRTETRATDTYRTSTSTAAMTNTQQQ